MTTYHASAEPNMSVIILITGFVVVFAVLILLIGIIMAYSKIVSSAQNASQKRKAKKQAQQAEISSVEEAVSEPVSSAPASDGSLDLQTVAVITAAVDAFYGDSKVRVVGIRPTSGSNTRSQWATAGLIESIPKMRSEGLL
ncbi:MAG: OadG family protein [Ruminococcus sp.]|nr:OadG family protein [Ruminococcus sp.]